MMNSKNDPKARAKNEIRRLRKMAAMGGSGSRSVFENQIAALKAKHGLWGVFGL
jgi:hypothetical protein